MKNKFILILLLGILIPWHAHAEPITHMIRWVYGEKIDGNDRAYAVYLPTGYDLNGGSTQYPVVFLLHGDRCAPLVLSEYMSLFDKSADSNKFILVVPQAMYNTEAEKLGRPLSGLLYNAVEADRLNLSWCLSNKAIVDGELSFLKKLHGIVSSSFKVDPARFYMAGHSRGGLLTQYAAMRLNAEFAAFASIASPETTYNASPLVLSDWRPGFRVPILLMNATADANVPYDYKIVQNFVDWIGVNHRPSDGEPRFRTIDTFTEKPKNIFVDKFLYCNGFVQFYIIQGGGHHWHGGNYFADGANLPLDTVCRDINTTGIVWNFFKNRRK